MAEEKPMLSAEKMIVKIEVSKTTNVISSLVYDSDDFQMVISFKPTNKSIDPNTFQLYAELNKEEKDPIEELASQIAIDLFKLIDPEFITVQIVRRSGSVSSEALAQKGA